MPFILQKLFDEGTSEPFFARMMMQNLELRDAAFRDEKEKREFDELYQPMLDALVECRAAMKHYVQSIEDHEMKIKSGVIISFQKHALNISESIDLELNKNFKDFFIKGTIALNCLNRICKHLGYPISFFFQTDSKFQAGIKKFLNKNNGSKFGDFMKLLQDDREKWHSQFDEVRNKIEHEGLTLPRIGYRVNATGTVDVAFPTMNHIPIDKTLNLFWNNLWEFAEDVIVSILSFKLTSPMIIAVVPENQRDPNLSRKYVISLPPEILGKLV